MPEGSRRDRFACPFVQTRKKHHLDNWCENTTTTWFVVWSDTPRVILCNLWVWDLFFNVIRLPLAALWEGWGPICNVQKRFGPPKVPHEAPPRKSNVFLDRLRRRLFEPVLILWDCFDALFFVVLQGPSAIDSEDRFLRFLHLFCTLSCFQF